MRSPASWYSNKGCFSTLDTFNEPVVRVHRQDEAYRGGMGLGVFVNDVLVTGEGYLYSGEEIFKVLELDNAKLSFLKKNESQVLSLGEGFGSLLDRFLRHGVEAKALDLWYHMNHYPVESFTGKKMSEFNSKYYDHLIRGSFTNIPYPNRSLDLIVASMLFNNIADRDVFIKGLEEMVRVLKVGGELRLVGLQPYQVDYISKMYDDVFEQRIDKIEIEKVTKDDTVVLLPVYRAILRKI